MSKKTKQAVSLFKEEDTNMTLEKLEAGIPVKIGDKTINQIYNEKLTKNIDLTETVSKTVSKPQVKVKIEKPKKELTDKGKKASERLSKYREQVKEALELKKNLELKKSFSYSDDEDEDDEDDDKPTLEPIKEEEEQIIPTMPIQSSSPPPLPTIDLSPIYNEIESLKIQNKKLEERFTYRNAVMDISNMRRNMSIKF